MTSQSLSTPLRKVQEKYSKNKKLKKKNVLFILVILHLSYIFNIGVYFHSKIENQKKDKQMYLIKPKK